MKTNYSRRELYALGETLGNSATYKKVTGGYVLGGGGGSPPPASPTQTTVQNTNIPEYAQPYVETMLGTAQQQIYNYDDQGNVTGMKPYQPYSNDPNAYIAGFSPLQQQAQSNVANMQTPGQYGQAMGQTGMGTMGAYGLAGQNVALGQTATPQTFQNQIGGYMNPYIQQSLAPQLQLLAQQTGINSAAEQGAATSRGAFGGSREALMNSLNQQQGSLAAQQAIAQGYNTAFGNAQNQYNQDAAFQLQANQAANAALGTGIQGAGQLGSLAGQQTQTGLNISQAQQAAGAAQQAQQQNIINQQIQNYATAQQYPMMQLSNMSGLLRGLPLQSTTTQTYQAAPSSVSQLAGLGTAALGVSKLAGAKAGGSVKDIKKMVTGGIASGVPAPKLDVMLSRLDDTQLAQKANPQQNDPQTAQAAASQQDFRAQMRPAGIGQNYNFSAAGGGIVAFAQGDQVKDDSSDIKSTLTKEYQTPIADQVASYKSLMPSTSFVSDYADQLKSLAPSASDTQSSIGTRLLQAGLGIMGGTSPYAAANIGQGSQAALQGYAQDVKEQKQQQMDLAKQKFELSKFGYNTEADIAKAVQADHKGTRDDLIKILGSEQQADATIKSAQIHAGATMEAAKYGVEKAGAKERQGIQTEFDALVAQGYDKDSPITKQIAQQNYFAATRPYGASVMVGEVSKALAQDGQIKAANTELQMATMAKDQAGIDAANAKIAARTKEIQAQVQNQMNSMKPGSPATQVPPPKITGGSMVQNKDGTFNYVPSNP
jgi:hypothetical protein